MQEMLKRLRLGSTALFLAATMVSPLAISGTYAQNATSTSAAALPESTIKALQEALNKQGIAVKADGVLTDATRNAIRKFQSQHHLSVTGEVDKATLDKLGVAAQAGMTPGSASTVGQTTAPTPGSAAPQAPTQPGQGSAGMMSGPMMQGMMQGMMGMMQGMMGMMQGQMQPGQMQGPMQPGMQRRWRQAPQGGAAMNCPMTSAPDQASMMQMMQGMMQMMQMMQNQMQSEQKPQGGQ